MLSKEQSCLLTDHNGLLVIVLCVFSGLAQLGKYSDPDNNQRTGSMWYGSKEQSPSIASTCGFLTTTGCRRGLGYWLGGYRYRRPALSVPTMMKQGIIFFSPVSTVLLFGGRSSVDVNRRQELLPTSPSSYLGSEMQRQGGSLC